MFCARGHNLPFSLHVGVFSYFTSSAYISISIISQSGWFSHCGSHAIFPLSEPAGLFVSAFQK